MNIMAEDQLIFLKIIYLIMMTNLDAIEWNHKKKLRPSQYL